MIGSCTGLLAGAVWLAAWLTGRLFDCLAGWLGWFLLVFCLCWPWLLLAGWLDALLLCLTAVLAGMCPYGRLLLVWHCCLTE